MLAEQIEERSQESGSVVQWFGAPSRPKSQRNAFSSAYRILKLNMNSHGHGRQPMERFRTAWVAGRKKEAGDRSREQTK
jgi:hypothetical protein